MAKKPVYVTDSRVLAHFMSQRGHLAPFIQDLFLAADRDEATILIPAIVWVELMEMAVANGLADTQLPLEALLRCDNYQLVPLTAEIFSVAAEINDIPVPNPKLVAATARYFDLPLITDDPKLKASAFVRLAK